jgi:hypothetical protein
MSERRSDAGDVDLYLVRLWTAFESATDFRAAVHRVGTDESAWFTCADALVEFFERQLQPNADSAEPKEAS